MNKGASSWWSPGALYALLPMTSRTGTLPNHPAVGDIIKRSQSAYVYMLAGRDCVKSALDTDMRSSSNPGSRFLHGNNAQGLLWAFEAGNDLAAGHQVGSGAAIISRSDMTPRTPLQLVIIRPMSSVSWQIVIAPCRCRKEASCSRRLSHPPAGDYLQTSMRMMCKDSSLTRQMSQK